MKKNDKTALLVENEELYQATLDEFSSKSYFQASTNEILKNSNYNKGSFYYRFANKQELFSALVDYVFTVQIELFNQKRINLSSILELKLIINKLFENLFDLFKKDNRYFYLLLKYFTDKTIDFNLSDKCIEPIFYRFMRIISDKLNVTNKKQFLVILKNLYFHFPEELFSSDDFSNEIETLVDFLVKDNQVKNPSLSSVFDATTMVFSDDINYILAKPSFFKFHSNSLLVSKMLLKYNKIKKELKKKLQIRFFNYKNLIDKASQNSFKDSEQFSIFYKSNIIKLVLEDKEFTKFLTICIYLFLTEPRIIIFDFLLSRFDKVKSEFILMNILPLLAKKSKILIVEEIIPYKSQFERISVLASTGYIEFNYLDLVEYFQNNVFITYLDDNMQKNKLISFSDLNDFTKLDFLSGKSIVSIETYSHISYDNLLKNEVFYEKRY